MIWTLLGESWQLRLCGGKRQLPSTRYNLPPTLTYSASERTPNALRTKCSDVAVLLVIGLLCESATDAAMPPVLLLLML